MYFVITVRWYFRDSVLGAVRIQGSTLTVIELDSGPPFLPLVRDALREADAYVGREAVLETLDVETTECLVIESLEEAEEAIGRIPGDQTPVLLVNEADDWQLLKKLFEQSSPGDVSFLPGERRIRELLEEHDLEFRCELVYRQTSGSFDPFRSVIAQSPESVTVVGNLGGGRAVEFGDFLDEINCDAYRFNLIVPGPEGDESYRVDEPEDFSGIEAPICWVLLERKQGHPAPGLPRPGIPDDYFLEGNNSLVYRSKVRSVCLGLMQIEDEEVVWEIGAGTGSVSLESARLNPDARYHTIEQNPEHFRHLSRNINRLEAFNVLPYLGRAPEIFESLPAPDVVFLGGTAGRTKQILQGLEPYLGPGDSLVASFLDSETVSETQGIIDDIGFRSDWSRVTVREVDNASDFSSNDVGGTVYFLDAEYRP